jgi:Ion channel
MAYLTAVTVTTLGFGDITPVTAMARALVAIEAVLGLVVIGLFVNAVARRPRSPAVV